MKIQELREKLTSLTRMEVGAEQHNKALLELVNSLTSLETDYAKLSVRLRQLLTALCLLTALALVALALITWKVHQSDNKLQHQGELLQRTIHLLK